MLLANAPVQLTSFVGRVSETEDVKRLLSTSRLVTITGAGGCGKTRLALAAAGRSDTALRGASTSTFADGIWLAELASLCDAGLAADSVAQALGVHMPPDQPILEALLSFVQPKRMLLVLDNCEHLIAACAELAQALLSVAPGLAILATSREPLGLAGEMLYQVPPLDLPPDLDPDQGAVLPPLSPETAVGYDGIRLFVERARAVLPGFKLTTANTEAVVAICRRLDGIPLAIELASARANILTVHEIYTRLDDRFGFLISGQRSSPIPRHRTLREAIDWSYDLLSEEEQVLLRRLAVFVAGFTLDTVEGVCGGEGLAEGRTLDLLSSLVSKSLVVASTLGRTEARYRLLESIRDYALEKTRQASEAARYRDRHLDLFLARAEEAAPRLGDAYQQLWLAWLESEHDNLRAALAWSLESARIEEGLRIAIALVRFWEIRGHVPEGLAWLERLLAQADDRVSVAVRVTAQTFACFLEIFQGNPAAGTARARAAVALAEAADERDEGILAFALSGLAFGAQATGDYQFAFSMMERLVLMCRKSGPSFQLGMGLLSQGAVATELGDFDAGRALLEESLALAREAGDVFRIGLSLNALGDLARCEQNYAVARTAYEEAVARLREIGAQHELASALGNLAHTRLHLGDDAGALALFDESMAAHQAQQNVPGVAEALVGFAAIAIVRGLLAPGVRLLAASAALSRQRVTEAWAATRAEYAHYLGLASAGLTEAECRTEEAAGRGLSAEQAADYARGLSLKWGPATPLVSKQDDLSEREREVAALIAQGRSNGEIAGDLVLSKRTVEKHVGSLFSKLGMTNRAQVVRWAIEHGLAASAP